MRGQVVERGQDKYLLRVYLGRDAHGKRQYHSKMFHGKPLAAQRELTKMLRELDTETLVRPTNTTFEQFVEEWYAWKVDVSAHTLRDYKEKIKRLLPVFGLRKLHAIAPVHIQTAIVQWINEGLSARTVEYHISILHQILDKAVELGILIRNPVDKVNVPTRTPRAFTVLSPEQMLQLFRRTQRDRYHAIWVLMLTTGLRPGETLGLKWDDLNGNLLTINRTVRGKDLLENHAKTDGSLRTIVLDELALDTLKAHRAKQNAEMLARGSHYQRNGFIFTSKSGKYLNTTGIRKSWKRTLKRAGLPENIRLYDCRHSHATVLLNEGVNMKAIADRLGHTSIRVTENVYARLMPKTREETASVMGRALQKAATR